MIEIFKDFFGTQDFMPHGHCYLWKPSLIWLHVISDSLIALSYYAIPACLVWFVKKRRGIPFKWIFLMFGIFIVACGTTHIMGIYTLWLPIYWLSGSVKAFTAVVSLGTAIVLIPLLPQALALRTPAEWEAAIQKLQEQMAERERTQAALRRSEERYHKMVAEVQDYAILRLSPDGDIETWSLGAESITGYKADEIIGANFRCFYTAEDQQTQKPDRLLQAARTEGRAQEENWRVHKDGSAFWASVTLTALHDEQGHIIGFSKVTRDLTERKHAEAERERLHKQLIDASRQAGMAEVATGVLHNVGNVLNSVNTAASLALEKLKTSSVADLTKVVALIDAHGNDLGTFIATDPQGQHLPPFLRHLTQHLLDERETLLEHLQMANDKVEHVKEIVAMQQSHAMGASTIESLSLATLMEDALNTNDESFRRHQVEVVREYAELPLILTDRHKVLQILINLVSNAKHALLAADSAPKQLIARVGTNDAEQVVLEVADNGVGIAAADLTQIFQYGFTTKAGGHGFGLHSSALMAQELGGSLTVHSDGLGRGAVFRLELPMQEARTCTV